MFITYMPVQNPESTDNFEYKMKKAGPRIEIIVETKLVYFKIVKNTIFRQRYSHVMVFYKRRIKCHRRVNIT